LSELDDYPRYMKLDRWRLATATMSMQDDSPRYRKLDRWILATTTNKRLGGICVLEDNSRLFGQKNL
jgi:hypothetical protein